MPVGGRINRRDNLRSKKDLIKSKSDKDNNSKPIQENVPGLHNLEILKRKNADAEIKSKQVTNKSEIIIDSLRSSYICLEDISLNQNLINIDNVKGDDISNLKGNDEMNNDASNQTKSKSNISKKKMKINKSNKEENDSLIIHDIISNNQNKIETKDNDENNTNIENDTKNKNEEFKDIKSDNIKRKGRPKAQKIDEPLTNQITNDCINTETTSKLKVIEKSEVRSKSRIPKKKDEPELTNLDTEKTINVTLTKLQEKKPNATTQIEESSIKSRSHQKKDETELSNLITEKSIPSPKLNEKKLKEVNQIEDSFKVELEIKQPDQDNGRMKSRQKRRNAIQKNMDQKTEETVQSYSPRKSRVRGSKKQTDSNDNTETVPLESVLTESTKNAVDLDASEEKMEVDQVDEPVLTEKPVDKLPVPTADIAVSSKRKATRKGKTRVPFVVEKAESDKQEVIAPVMKNPGLQMLENIRNRKSALIKPTVVQEISKSVTKPAEVKQHPEDIQEHKQETVTEKKDQSDSAPSWNERKNVQEKKRYSSVKPIDKNQTSVDAGDDIVPMEIDKEPLKLDTVSIQKKTRKSEVHQATKPPKQPEAKSTVPPETKIPGLRMIEDIRRRKSELAASSSKTLPVAVRTPTVAASPAKSTTTVRQSILPVGDVAPVPPKPASATKESKIPGLATIEELKSYSRQSIHSPVKDRISGLAKRTRQTVTGTSSEDVSVPVATEKVPVTSGSEKVPGLSVTSVMHKQKMMPPTPVSSVAFQSPVASRPTMEVGKSVASSTGKSILPPHLQQSARGTPISILCKSSPYKRPISCVTDESDGHNADSVPGQSVRKMARVQAERRQSVTFNREVAVKEIHGNSFNSVSDDQEQPELPDRSLNASLAKIPTDEFARAEFERKLESELERTKNFLKDRRFNSSGTGMSRQKEMAAAHQLAMISKPVRPLTKKRSDLSNLISERAKLTSISPPRVPLASAVRGNGAGNPVGGGASKKITPLLRRQEIGSHSVDQWKSFRNPVPIPDVDDDQDDDDSMSCEETPAQSGNKDQGRSCVVM